MLTLGTRVLRGWGVLCVPWPGNDVSLCEAAPALLITGCASAATRAAAVWPGPVSWRAALGAGAGTAHDRSVSATRGNGHALWGRAGRQAGRVPLALCWVRRRRVHSARSARPLLPPEKALGAARGSHLARAAGPAARGRGAQPPGGAGQRPWADAAEGPPRRAGPPRRRRRRRPTARPHAPPRSCCPDRPLPAPAALRRPRASDGRLLAESGRGRGGASPSRWRS